MAKQQKQARTSYSDEDKRGYVSDYLAQRSSGITQYEYAESYQISPSTFVRWVSLYRSELESEASDDTMSTSSASSSRVVVNGHANGNGTAAAQVTSEPSDDGEEDLGVEDESVRSVTVSATSGGTASAAGGSSAANKEKLLKLKERFSDQLTQRDEEIKLLRRRIALQQDTIRAQSNLIAECMS